MSERNPKVAVILIHGIGEQKPMSTLRSFVKAVLDPPRDGSDAFWSKPDPSSRLFELRRLQARGRSDIHFYEFYWAHHIQGTTWTQLLTWLRTLLCRDPLNVPGSARKLWLITWVLILGLTFSVIASVRDAFQAGISLESYWLYATLVLSGAALLVQKFFVGYLGDAARYLSPSPENVALRQTIRAEGVSLLRHLHGKDYDRIILIGHSLGSVIGYDMITSFWIETNQIYRFTDPAIEPDLLQALSGKSKPQDMVRNGLFWAGKSLQQKPTPEALHKFQDAQLQGWKEHHRWGNPWLITDFITIGSPLTHARLLLAATAEEFEERKRQREFPTCPPVEDRHNYRFPLPSPISLNIGGLFTPWILHHAAPFAVTRWTNLYFPTRLGVFGDFIGGPLQREFGPGIEDVAVTWDSWRSHTPIAHTAYWKLATGRSRDGAVTGLHTRSLFAVRRALRLDERIRR